MDKHDGQRIVCPYCGTLFFYSYDDMEWFSLYDELFYGEKCPSCEGVFLFENYGEMIYPPKSEGKCPQEVPAEYRQDYLEAYLVLSASPKASAALSRRLLQRLLREHLGIKAEYLAKEIQQLIDTGQLPSNIIESLDAVRHVGNFAAHPIKDQNTGVIVDVEPEEATWLIHVLGQLFDLYFVQPELRRKQKEALNQKLLRIGKPPMK